MNRYEKIICNFKCEMCRKKHCLLKKRKLHRTPHREDKKYCLSMYLERIHEAVESLNPGENDVIVFRGHKKESYTLLPYLFRENYGTIKEKEAEFIRKIEAVHPEEFSGKTTLDKLVHLQHYGFPTRLLDVTLNPLVALYFAVRELGSQDSDDTDGAVIICKVSQKFIKVFDDPIVVALANLANLSEEEKQCVRNYKEDELKEEQQTQNDIMRKSLIDLLKPIIIWGNTSNEPEIDSENKSKINNAPKIEDNISSEISKQDKSSESKDDKNSENKDNDTVKDTLRNFGKTVSSDPQIVSQNYSRETELESAILPEEIKKFLGLIRAELPSFPGSLAKDDLREPVYVMPKQFNARIRAQSGAFLLFGLLESLDESERFPQDKQVKVTISRHHKRAIREELNEVKINEAEMFPEFHKFLEYLIQTNRKV